MSILDNFAIQQAQARSDVQYRLDKLYQQVAQERNPQKRQQINHEIQRLQIKMQSLNRSNNFAEQMLRDQNQRLRDIWRPHPF